MVFPALERLLPACGWRSARVGNLYDRRVTPYGDKWTISEDLRSSLDCRAGRVRAGADRDKERLYRSGTLPLRRLLGDPGIRCPAPRGGRHGPLDRVHAPGLPVELW